MQDNSADAGQCRFTSEIRQYSGAVVTSTCRAKTLGGYGYCEHHLKLLTRENVKRQIAEIAYLETGITKQSEVYEHSLLVRDLGADSIDTAELVARIESEFDIEVPDEDAEKLVSVRDLIEYVFGKLLKQGKYLPSPPQGVKPARPELALRRMIRGKPYSEYYEKLGLNAEEVVRIIVRVVGERPVDHITPAPYYKNGKPADGIESVHIFFLGRDRLFYFGLGRGSLTFEWASLKDLRLVYEFVLGGEGKKVSSIKVWLGAQEPGSDAAARLPADADAHGGHAVRSLRDATFIFRDRGGEEGAKEVEGAELFLEKFLANSEGSK